MRVLFVMLEPGYLRLYGDTINALAQRGHEVLLAYNRPYKRAGDALLPAGAPPSVRFLGEVPWGHGEWSPLVHLLRRSADYARFLDPRFADAQPLRDRMDKFLPERASFLRGSGTLPRPAARLMLWAFRRLERAIPPDAAVRDFLGSPAPDALVITPVVARGEAGVNQTEAVKAGRSLGVPTAVAVGSWDHLTSKGLLRGDPDRLLVWNELQRTEAVELHAVPDERVAVTGAQPFDRWFDMHPRVEAAEFARRVGLPADRPFILYVGSSRGIAKPQDELRFVRRWVDALRTSASPVLRDLAILVRPHPANMEHWRSIDGWAEGVTVFPRQRPALPMTSDEEADFFESLWFSSAVMGINTSAMIEAAIVGRPVLTVRAPEFRRTQDGTVHFRYLIPEGGGAVQVGGDMTEHTEQLIRTLRDPARVHQDLRTFVGRFVRPRGLEQAATPILVEEIESLGRLSTTPRTDVSPGLRPLSLAMRHISRRLEASPGGRGHSRKRGRGRSLRRHPKTVGRRAGAWPSRCAAWPDERGHEESLRHSGPGRRRRDARGHELEPLLDPVGPRRADPHPVMTEPREQSPGLELDPALAEAMAVTERRKGATFAVRDVSLLGRIYTTPWIHRLLPIVAALPLAWLWGRAKWVFARSERAEAVDWAADFLREPSSAGPVQRLARRAMTEAVMARELALRPWAARRWPLEGYEHLEVARAQERGVVAVSGHPGEIRDTPHLLNAQGVQIYFVAGAKIARGATFRGHAGRVTAMQYERFEPGESRAVPRGGAYRVLEALLRRGEACGIAFDIAGGVETSFLSRRVMLGGGAATLAFETGALVVPLFSIRRGLRMTVLMLEPIDPHDFSSVSRLHDHLAEVVGRVVLEHAEQYYPHRLKTHAGPTEKSASGD